MVLGALSNYFLNPVGLATLAALVPLIIFYLIKPEPVEKVMPSMQFFMEDEREGKVSQAIQTLKQNLLLILHVLMVLLFTAAIAQLYLSGFSAPEKAVVVLDTSASMSDDMENARSFISSNAGRENTLITVDEDVEVAAREASASRLEAELSSIEAKDLETDIASALDLATNFEGQLVVASDLDQTVNSRNVEEQLESIASERDVKVMKPDRRNSWGIIDVEADRENSSVDVKNFRESPSRIDVRINGEPRKLKIEGGAVKTVSFKPESRNRVELESDSMNADNTAFISMPGSEKVQVAIISDKEAPYMSKAFELISFTEVTQYRPPLKNTPEADVYIVRRTNKILQESIDSIENNVKNGDSLVVYAQTGLRQLGIESLPVRVKGGMENSSVEIIDPVRVNLGDTKSLEVKKTVGKSLSTPSTGLISSSHGSGKIVFANFRDSDFRHRFLYPVFWKELVGNLAGRTEPSELNIETGRELNTTGKGLKTVENSGFHNSSGITYAANLLSEDESVTEEVEFEGSASEKEKSRKNLQTLLALLLAITVLGELGYLKYTGDV